MDNEIKRSEIIKDIDSLYKKMYSFFKIPVDLSLDLDEIKRFVWTAEPKK